MYSYIPWPDPDDEVYSVMCLKDQYCSTRNAVIGVFVGGPQSVEVCSAGRNDHLERTARSKSTENTEGQECGTEHNIILIAQH